MEKEERICEFCGEVIKPLFQTNQRFCGKPKNCAHKFYNKKLTEAYHKMKEVKNANMD